MYPWLIAWCRKERSVPCIKMDKIFPRRDDLSWKTFQGLPSQLFILSHWHAISSIKLWSCVLKPVTFILVFIFSLCYSYWKDLPISRLNIFAASSYSFTLLRLPFGVTTPFPSLAFTFRDVFIGRKHIPLSSLILLNQTSQILSARSRKTCCPDLWSKPGSSLRPFPPGFTLLGRRWPQLRREIQRQSQQCIVSCHISPKQLLFSFGVPTLKSSTAVFSHPYVSSHKFGLFLYQNRWLFCPLIGSWNAMCTYTSI